VETSAALAADLKALTEVLDRPGVDLEALLHAFADDTKRAVDSYLGLTMTMTVDTHPVTLSTMDSTNAATSLRVPLDGLGAIEPGSVLLLYADKPGAFIDLAADLTFALGMPPDTLTLDDDLSPARQPPGVDGLLEQSRVNQALGILIDRGHLPGSAHAELHRLARDARATLPAIAAHLIATTQPGPL
jgi:hypothetical protein